MNKLYFVLGGLLSVACGGGVGSSGPSLAVLAGTWEWQSPILDQALLELSPDGRVSFANKGQAGEEMSRSQARFKDAQLSFKPALKSYSGTAIQGFDYVTRDDKEYLVPLSEDHSLGFELTRRRPKEKLEILITDSLSTSQRLSLIQEWQRWPPADTDLAFLKTTFYTHQGCELTRRQLVVAMSERSLTQAGFETRFHGTQKEAEVLEIFRKILESDPSLSVKEKTVQMLGLRPLSDGHKMLRPIFQSEDPQEQELQYHAAVSLLYNGLREFDVCQKVVSGLNENEARLDKTPFFTDLCPVSPLIEIRFDPVVPILVTIVKRNPLYRQRVMHALSGWDSRLVQQAMDELKGLGMAQ